MWLFGIATNLIRRHRRTEKAIHRAQARAGGRRSEHVAADSIVDDRVVSEQQWARASKVLAGLNATDRDLLLLFAWADLSYEAIAVVAELPLGTVKSRINRARTKLRARLGPDGPGATDATDGPKEESP